MEKLILVGAGGYAKSVIDSINQDCYEIVGFIEEVLSKKEHLGFPVLANSLEELECAEQFVYFISIGDNVNRKKWYDRIQEKSLKMINIIDSTAIISPGVSLGKGCFVGKMAIINSNSKLGNNCIVNTKALVEHGCFVADHVNLSTNSVINGDVYVGEGCFVGSCSVTIGQLKLGKWSTIGAGAVVIKDVKQETVVVGNPAKEVKRKERG